MSPQLAKQDFRTRSARDGKTGKELFEPKTKFTQLIRYECGSWLINRTGVGLIRNQIVSPLCGKSGCDRRR